MLAVLAQTETTHAVAHWHAETECSSAVTQLPLSSPGLPVIATELKTMTYSTATNTLATGSLALAPSAYTLRAQTAVGVCWRSEWG